MPMPLQLPEVEDVVALEVFGAGEAREEEQGEDEAEAEAARARARRIGNRWNDSSNRRLSSRNISSSSNGRSR